MINLKDITLETSKLATKLNVNKDLKSEVSYTDNGIITYNEFYNENEKLYILIPKELLAKWIREKYNINIYVVMDINKKYIVWIQDIVTLKKFKTTYFYDTYEDALEDGLQTSLKYIQENKLQKND